MAFDFFLAHSSSDELAAELLYELLTARGASVFLDSKSLGPGDLWDRRLAEAQKDSRATVLLLSASTSDSYYESEEVATAIALSRTPGERHRVVPLFLSHGLEPPYGLRRVHSLEAIGHHGLVSAADELLKLSHHSELSLPPPSPGGHALSPPQTPFLEGGQVSQQMLRGQEFFIIRTEEELRTASNAVPLLLVTGHAERGPGEQNAIARLRREIYPSIRVACERLSITVGWANVTGVIGGFKRDPINDYLTKQGLRYAGVHLFRNGRLIATERVARFTALSSELVAAALRIIEN